MLDQESDLFEIKTWNETSTRMRGFFPESKLRPTQDFNTLSKFQTRDNETF
jgi:hypothetical protein